jgi:hypothetical protein
MTTSALGLEFGPILIRSREEESKTILNTPHLAAAGKAIIEVVGEPVVDSYIFLNFSCWNDSRQNWKRKRKRKKSGWRWKKRELLRKPKEKKRNRG